MRFLCAFAALAATASLSIAGDLPDPTLTPGVINPAVTDVCKVKWGLDRRHVTLGMKRQVFSSYNISCYPANVDEEHVLCSRWEVDHLISRELGGADGNAGDVRNLWPQKMTGPWNAKMKDRLENRLHKEVCDGTITLKQAQRAIRDDWRKAWTERFGK